MYRQQLKDLESRVAARVAALDMQPSGLQVVEQAVNLIADALNDPSIQIEINKRAGTQSAVDVLDVDLKQGRSFPTYYRIRRLDAGYQCAYMHGADTGDFFTTKTSEAAWYVLGHRFAPEGHHERLLAQSASIRAKKEARIASQKRWDIVRRNVIFALAVAGFAATAWLIFSYPSIAEVPVGAMLLPFIPAGLVYRIWRFPNVPRFFWKFRTRRNVKSFADRGLHFGKLIIDRFFK